MKANLSMHERMVGCVLGGALGDALGAHVEFLSWPEIAAECGSAGITELEPTYGRRGAVTDDTQMTAFTIEAAIRWHVAQRMGVPTDFATAMWRGYLRWLVTQDSDLGAATGDGWLLARPWLHHRRAPGNTNLTALRGGVMGRVDAPINDSRGCGAFMRCAPLGIAAPTAAEAFERGVLSGAVTHTEPGGYLPAGIASAATYLIATGSDIETALRAAAELAEPYLGSGPTLDLLERGLVVGRRGLPGPPDIEELGGGWQGHEALAIVAACVLSDAPMVDVLRAAANHGGDSDSTASIAGHLVGVRDGVVGIPATWLTQLEGCDDLVELANDYVDELESDQPLDSLADAEWLVRYPPERVQVD